MTRGGYGESHPVKKVRKAQAGVDSLSKRPAVFPDGHFFARWETGQIFNPGDGTVLDWSGCSFDTNHDTLFPSIDGPGLAEVFGGPEQVPVIDYAVKGDVFPNNAACMWALTCSLHQPQRAGWHRFEVQPQNVGGGGSVGFTAGYTPKWHIDMAADFSGWGDEFMRYFEIDQASFGGTPGGAGLVAQAVRYVRSLYTDTNDQQINYMKLWCVCAAFDVGIYAP
jgi:hypothetical protein